VTRSGLTILVLVAPMFFTLAARLENADLDDLAITSLGAAVGVVVVAIWNCATLGSALAPMLQRYELLVSDRVLRCTGDGPVAEVLRAEVRELVETIGGLWISCPTPRRSLFVTRDVDGYGDVREIVSSWAPMESAHSLGALWHSRRERVHQGPRDAIRGTALASDATLASELETVRAASAHGYEGVRANGATWRRAVSLFLWVASVIAFLNFWPMLQPPEGHVLTDRMCRKWPSCKNWGACKARNGRCIAETDDDCRQSEACRKLGRCSSIGGFCYGEKPQNGCSLPP
jgi:hypothetical protein